MASDATVSASVRARAEADRADKAPGDTSILGDTGHGDRSTAGNNSKSSSTTPLTVEEVVIEPKRIPLPALCLSKQVSVSIPSLENTKVGPQNFEKIRLLGAGSTGRVYLVKSVGLPSEAFYAMKVVKKSELVKRNRVQRILTEQQILSVANHPFIVTLHYSFQSVEYFYLIMQYCAGGEFFSFLHRQEKQRLSEAHAQFYAAEVLIALEYLHLLGIIYRDLKPENILVHESGHIMLSDFDLAHELKSPSKAALAPSASFTSGTGYSSPGSSPRSTFSSTVPCPHENSLWFRIVDRKKSVVAASMSPATTAAAAAQAPPVAAPPRSCFPLQCLCGTPVMYPEVDTESHLELGEKRTSFVGTHEYVAPEIIAEEGYVGSVDWWAFGILLYEMIYSTTPFKGPTQIQTLENILDLNDDIDFPSDVPVSDDTKDLIRRLLDKTVSRRLHNPLQIKAHPFFRGICWPLIRHSKPPIVPDFVHTLKERQLSPDKMSSLDDEVPFAAGVSSPNNTPRRKHSSFAPTPSSQKAGSSPPPLFGPTAMGEAPTSSPSAITGGASASASLTPVAGSRSSSASASDRTNGMSAYLSDPVATTSPQVAEPSPASEAAERTEERPSPSVSSANEATVSVPSFDFTGSSKPGYWSSTESTRTLHAKLSELRLAVPEEEGPDDHAEQ